MGWWHAKLVILHDDVQRGIAQFLDQVGLTKSIGVRCKSAVSFGPLQLEHKEGYLQRAPTYPLLVH